MPQIRFDYSHSVNHGRGIHSWDCPSCTCSNDWVRPIRTGGDIPQELHCRNCSEKWRLTSAYRNAPVGDPIVVAYAAVKPEPPPPPEPPPENRRLSLLWEK